MAAYMILPSKDVSRIRLLRVPDDYEAHEAYRKVTGLIAGAEEGGHEDWEAMEAALEEAGFETLPFQLGPLLD